MSIATATPTVRTLTSLGPNVRINYEMAAGMTLADMAWAHAEQTRIFRRFQSTFRDYDLVLSPTTPVSPFPWTQLYLEGSKARGCATIITGWRSPMWSRSSPIPPSRFPAASTSNAMPFGLQVVGRFRGDSELLDAAEAMEHAFARIPGLGRPCPDLAKLKSPASTSRASSRIRPFSSSGEMKRRDTILFLGGAMVSGR